MRKIYINPTLQVAYVDEELPVAQSNTVGSQGVSLNPNTMKEGDGSDAVKANSYNVWDDDWNKSN